MEIVRCLLRARTDYITVRNVAWSFPTPDPGWTRCLDCRINQLSHGHCSVCDDTGFRRRKRNEPEFDKYTRGLAQQLPASQLEPQRPAERLNESTEDRWLRQREERNPAGSLDRVEAAVRQLPDAQRSFLSLVYTSGLLDLKHHATASREARIVAGLASAVTGRLEPPAWDRAAIHALRVKAVRQLAGESTRDIARAVGCSQRLVRSVLAEAHSQKVTEQRPGVV